MDVPEAVFVYGTLKRGERNFAVSQQAGWILSEPAYIEGFQLFHIPRRKRLPYSYPAVVQGLGQVWGEVQWFADLSQALVLLDELEDQGREYLRISTIAHLERFPQLGRSACNAIVGTVVDHPEEKAACSVWVYAYPGLQNVQRVSGLWLPEGVWREMEGQKG